MAHADHPHLYIYSLGMFRSNMVKVVMCVLEDTVQEKTSTQPVWSLIWMHTVCAFRTGSAVHEQHCGG